MRDDRRNFLIVGTFVLSMLVALLAWIALLAGFTGKGTDNYFTVYKNVTGLSSGTQILYEGYPVGMIEAIEPVEVDGRPRFRVDLSVKRGWKLAEDSRAAITSSGLISAVVIDIRAGESDVLLEPGSEIRGTEMADIFGALSALGGEIENLIEDNVRPLLMSVSEGTPQIVANLESFTADLNQTVDQINDLLKPDNVNRIGRILQNLEGVTEQMSAMVEDLDDSRAQVNELLGKVNRLMDQNEGEVGHAIVDLHHTLEAVASHIDAISHNLEVTTRNMNEFTRQIRANPGLILRGRDAGDDTAKAGP